MQLEESIAKELADIVRAQILSFVVGVDARIAALETRISEKGDKGDPGDKGDKGEPGADGKNGETIVGPKGDPGSTIRFGKGEPEQTGRPDDVYLDIETGNLYQFKS